MRRWALLILLFPSLALAEPALEEFQGGTIPEDARQAMREALVEEVPLLGEQALAPRPAGVAKAKMDDVAKRFPQVAAVQRYLGRACYATGDVSAAETAYKAAVQISLGAPWALTQLADFYADRNDPKNELLTLDRLADAQRSATVGGIGAAATSDGKNALRITWQRAQGSAAAHAGPGIDPAKYDRLIVELYPDDPSYLRRHIDGFLAAERQGPALAEVARYRKRFPGELRYFAQIESSVAESRREPDKAEAVYRALLSRDPAPASIAARDSDGIYDDYLDLLKRIGREREVKRALSAKARAGRIAGFDLALLVHLHVHAGDRDQAKKVLDHAAAQAAPTGELILRARLYATLGAPAEAVPILYEAFRKAAPDATRDEALGELGLALLQGDLGRTGLTPLGPLDGFDLRHVASGPSVAGGLASLIFNGARSGAAQDLDRVQAAYGNGARAASVLAELKKTAPKSRYTAALTRELLHFRRAYRDDADAIRLCDDFARAFPKDKAYFTVGRDGCDSHWRSTGSGAGRTCYQRLLDESARRGDAREYDATLRAFTGAWERDKKQVEVVRLFWAEIARHPGDPTLYDRFLEHTARHNLFDEELKVYQEGVKRFPTTAWYDRLARWHLRHKGKQAFRDLTERLLAGFDDEVAVSYLDALVDWRRDELDSHAFYEAIYQHALDRFPLDQRFALKLIAFHDRNDRGARAGKYIKRFAFYNKDLRARLLRELAESTTLDATVARLGKGANVVERQVAASGLVFLSRQEEAEPILAALCSDFPGDVALARRHAALWRALARPSARGAAQRAAELLDGLTKLFPADESVATEAGDYLSEAGQYDEGRKRFYERIVAMRPSDPEAYLRLASIDWDYFHFDAAAESIGRARKRSGDPLRFAEKLAAVYESRKDYPSAIAEYVRIVIAAQKLDARPRTPPSDEQRGDLEGEEGGWQPEPEGNYGEQGGEEAALARLKHLAGRKKLAASVDKAWKAQAKAGDGRAVLGYAAWLATDGDLAARRVLLAAEAARTTDPRLLQRIAADARGDGEAHAVLIAALSREAALGKGAPSYVYPLVDALVEDRRDADAERELKALIDRLDAGGEDDRDEAVEARIAHADFLWKRKRADEAIAARATAADKATGPRQIDLRLEVVGWQLAHGKLDDAERLGRALLDPHPGALRFVRPVADALWQRGQRDQAVALYEAQIQAARKRADSDDVKRALIADLRHALRERLDQAGRPREAVDQWIEIVNRRPEERSEIAALHAYAALHNLLARVTAYYTKTAATSARDHRWPVVLAVLADLSGDPSTAAARLGDALLISPDRIDLGTERAEAFARAGDAASAAVAYHRLWELTDHDPKWAGSEATMLARAGKRPEAIAAVKRLVEGDPADPSPWFRAAELLDRAGLVDEAHGLAAQGIDKARKDLHAQSLGRNEAGAYARLAVRAGKGQEAFRALLTLEERARAEAGVEGNSEPWRASTTADACHDAAGDALPKAVAQFASDGDARRFIDQVRERAQGDEGIERMARIANAAGRPDVVGEIYKRGSRLGGTTGESYADRLVRDLAEAGQWDAIVRAVDGDPAASPSALLAKAHACRTLGGAGAGDACEEAALKQYVGRQHHGDPLQWRFGDRDPAVARYLEILLARRREAELVALADQGTWHAGQITSFLFAHGRADLGTRALAAAGQSETPAWRSAKQAGALLALGGSGPRARELLAEILAPAPIGTSVGHRPDEQKEVIGRRWYRYAERYGDALAQSQQPAEARRYYAAAVEDRPLDAGAYVEQGDSLERITDHRAAEAAFEHALQLKPGDVRAIDHLARALLAAGDRKRALATWDRVLGKRATDRAHRSRFDLVMAAGLVEEARAPFAAHLAAGWTKRGASEAGGDLWVLGQAFPSRASGSEWEKYLRSLLDKSGWKDLPLLELMVGTRGNALLERDAFEPYLRMGLARATDGDWREALAAWGIAERHFDATLDAVDGAQKALGDQPLPRWAVLARARARAGKGEKARAIADLRAWTQKQGSSDEDRTAAADLLHELASPVEWEVRADLYGARVARAGHGAADEVGLADARMHQGRRDEATLILKRLVVRRLDDEEAWRLAAACAETWKLAPLAIDLRRRLAEILPRDGENLLALARGERDAGTPDRAVTLAASLIGDRAVETSVRRGAALLLGELGRARVGGAADALASASVKAQDEPLALGRAAFAGDPGTQALTDALRDLAAPRTALAELATRAVKRGRHGEAAGYLRRLRALGVSDEQTRRQQLEEERAAGHPRAALAALADQVADRFVAATTAPRAELDAAEERAIDDLIAQRKQELALLSGDQGRRLLESATAAAAEATDLPRLAFYRAVAAWITPSEETRRTAKEARATVDAARARSARVFVTAALDDLSVTPAGRPASAALPGGKR
ncbi:MAG: hypothetical protein EXR72_04610 [Myxococcales bacterium]|nr:hypothetical protein [Myxococcales bacterium]